MGLLETIPQPDGQSQSAASNGIDLPPAAPGGYVDLPPDPARQGQDLPPVASDQADKAKFIAQEWYKAGGQALQNGASKETAKQAAIDYLTSQAGKGTTEWQANGPAGRFGGVTQEMGKTDENGKGEASLPLVQHGLTSSTVTPEGWGRYVRSTATPEEQAGKDAEFEQKYNLTKALEARSDKAMSIYKNAGGSTKPGESGEGDLHAVAVTDRAMKDLGLPPLTPQEMGVLTSLKYSGPQPQNWFLDTTGDVAGELARGLYSSLAAPGQLAARYAAASFAPGSRANLALTNVAGASEQAQQAYNEKYTPAPSGRTDAANFAATSIAGAAPLLLEAALTEGAGLGPLATRITQAIEGGTVSGNEFRKNLVSLGRQQGMSEADANTMGLQGAAIVGPVAAGLQLPALHQIFDNNPSIRPFLIRALASAGVVGPVMAAQNTAEQLTRMGLAGGEFSVSELAKALASGAVVGAATAALPPEKQPGYTVKPGEGVEAKTPFLETPEEPAPVTTPPQGAAEAPESVRQNMLPAEHPLYPLAKQLDELQAKADELLNKRGGGAAEPLQGQLPNETDLATGQPEHPLITMLKDSGVEVAAASPKLMADPDVQFVTGALKRLGLDPVPAEGKDMPSGMTSPEHPNSVLFNAAKPREALEEAVGHEVGHVLFNTSPEVAAEIIKAAPPGWLNENMSELWTRYEKAYGKEFADKYRSQNEDTEKVAVIVQKAAQEDSYVRRALEKQPGVWNAIKDAVSRTLNTFTQGGRMRNKLVDALHDAFGTEPAKAPVEAEANQIPEANFLPSKNKLDGSEPEDSPRVEGIRYEIASRTLRDRVANAKATIAEGLRKRTTEESFSSSGLDKARQKMIDAQESILRSASIAGKRGALPSAEGRVDHLLAATYGKMSSLEAEREYGRQDSEGRPVLDKGQPMNLRWKLSPAADFAKAYYGNANEESIMKSMATGASLLDSQSVLEREANKPNSFSVAQVKQAQDFMDKVKDIPGRQHLDELARRYRLDGNVVLQRLVDEGFIKPEVAKMAVRSNQFYSNMQRVMDPLIGENKAYEGSAKLYKFRGGSDRVKDNPFVNQMVTQDRMLYASSLNKLSRVWVDQVKSFPDLAEKMEPSAKKVVHWEKTPEGYQTTGESEAAAHLDILRAGSTERWSIPPEVQQSIQSLHDYNPEFAYGALNIFGRMLRTGVTKSPAYALRNFSRDTQTRLKISQSGSGLTDFSGMTHENMAKMKLAGGDVMTSLRGNRANAHATIQSVVHDMSDDKSTIRAVATKAWQGYESVQELAEQANRLAEFSAAYKKAKSRGMSDRDATRQAVMEERNLMDFAKAGAIVREANRICYTPFLVSRITGVDNNVQAFRRSAGLYAYRGFLQGTLPALMGYAWANVSGHKEEYDALPLWRKVMGLNLWIGTPGSSSKFLYIPFDEEGSVFAAPVAYATEKFGASRNDVGPSVLAQVARGAMPGSPTSLPGWSILEDAANHSFYYGKPIVWDSDKPLEQRDVSSATRLSKGVAAAAQAAGWQLDPRYVDHVIQGQFGSLGGLVSQLSDIGAKPFSSWESLALRATGVTSSIPGSSSPDVQYVLQNAQKYYQKGSPEVKAMEELFKQGYNAKTQDEQDELFARGRQMARSIRQDFQTNGSMLTAVGKVNSDINVAEQTFKSLDTYQKRLQWLSDNPDQKSLLTKREGFDKIEQRINELKKLTVDPRATPALKDRIAPEIKRLYGLLVNYGSKP